MSRISFVVGLILALLLIGCAGPIGEQGTQGVQGPQGEQGVQGGQGSQGDTGAQGEHGVQGPQGGLGPQGEQGEAGIQGKKGDKGDTGIQGKKGDKGDTGQGVAGDRGQKGDKGNEGDLGARGPRGIKGDKGESGEQGPEGEPGKVHANGVVVIPLPETFSLVGEKREYVFTLNVADESNLHYEIDQTTWRLYPPHVANPLRSGGHCDAGSWVGAKRTSYGYDSTCGSGGRERIAYSTIRSIERE